MNFYGKLFLLTGLLGVCGQSFAAANLMCQRPTEQIRLAMAVCEQETRLLNCEGLSKNEDGSVDKDVQAHLRTCSAEEVAQGTADDDFAVVNSCLDGAGVAWGEFRDFFIHGFEYLQENFVLYSRSVKTNLELAKKHEPLVANCDVTCKRWVLAQKHPLYSDPRQVSDEKLAQIPARTLEEIGNRFALDNARFLQDERARNFDPHKKAAEMELLRSRMTPEEMVKAAKSFMTLAREHLRKEDRRWSCYKKGAYPEMLCYGLFTVVDPTLALGLTVKGGRLATMALRSAVSRARTAPDNSALVSRLLGGIKGQSKGEITEVAANANRLRFEERNLKLSPTTTVENRAFIQEAKTVGYGSGGRFVDIENSVLKTLNDTLKDKNLVTAMTNKHKEILFFHIEELEAKYAGKVEIIKQSDFKSTRFYLKPVPPLKEVPLEVEKDLEKLFKISNQEFETHLKVNGIIRETDQPKEWFRGGIGETADEANNVARYSRHASGENKLRNFRDPDYKENMTVTLKWAELHRSEISKDLEGTSLLTTTASGKEIPRVEVFDIIKKKNDVQAIRETIVARFGGTTEASRRELENKLTDPAIQRLMDYHVMVDEFSPPIWVEERKITSLKAARQGGLSADFAGMGAKNMRGTAEALAESKDLRDALAKVRVGETAVTAEFKKNVAEFEKTVRKYYGDATSSGDDFVAAARRSVSDEQKQNLMNELANQPNPSGKRLALIDEGVPASIRDQLTFQGEKMEVELRSQLVGVIPEEKLSQMIFAVNMKTKNLDKGPVDLIIGSRPGALTETEREIVREKFVKAVEKFNQGSVGDRTLRAYSVQP